MARFSFRFAIYSDDVYQVTLSTHEWYRIFLNGEVLERGELPFELVDDAWNNDNYLCGYAACLLDLYLKKEDSEFPIYKRGINRKDLWEEECTNANTEPA